VEELTLIADGSKVTKIVGDQVTKAEFRYFMPNQQLSIQREVVFTCENGDWRAEG
jgi:S-ribosylhomocysteine lyase LuxS involved in autoinducer biosynthesis